MRRFADLNRRGTVMIIPIAVFLGMLIGSALNYFFGEGQAWWVILLMYLGPMILIFLIEVVG